MRHYYTPIFRDILSSSVWANDPDVRIVWFTLLLLADPEGYVPGAAPGLAIAANVPLERVRHALALFESPDPDSRSHGSDGRRIEKVDRGWRILNFQVHAERAKSEATKARKRRWARNNNLPANDVVPEIGRTLDATETQNGQLDANLDASKSKSKSIPPKKEGSPLPPAVEEAEPPAESGVLPATFHTLEGFEATQALRDDAVMAGVPDFDERLAALRTGPIGGTRGVLDREAYVRSQFPKWRRWRETEAAKARQATQAPPGRAFGGGRGPVFVLEPTARHRAFAAKHDLDLDAIVRALSDEGVIDALGAHGAREELGKALSKAARGKAVAKCG